MTWRQQRSVSVRPCYPFRTREGWRWWKLALYLDFPRHSPEYISDVQIDNVINKAWKEHPPLFELDRDNENRTPEACARNYSDGTLNYTDDEPEEPMLH